MKARTIFMIAAGIASAATGAWMLTLPSMSCGAAVANLKRASEALGPAVAVYEQLEDIDEGLVAEWSIKAAADYQAKLRAYQQAQDQARYCQ